MSDDSIYSDIRDKYKELYELGLDICIEIEEQIKRNIKFIKLEWNLYKTILYNDLYKYVEWRKESCGFPCVTKSHMIRNRGGLYTPAEE